MAPNNPLWQALLCQFYGKLATSKKWQLCLSSSCGDSQAQCDTFNYFSDQNAWEPCPFLQRIIKRKWECTHWCLPIFPIRCHVWLTYDTLLHSMWESQTKPVWSLQEMWGASSVLGRSHFLNENHLLLTHLSYLTSLGCSVLARFWITVGEIALWISST